VAGIAGAEQVYTTGGAKALSATLSANVDWAIAAIEIKEAVVAAGLPPRVVVPTARAYQHLLVR